MMIFAKGNGLYELADISDGWCYVGRKYICGRNLIYDALLCKNPKARILIASLAQSQKTCRKFLITKGFKQIGKSRRNPNSGSMIAVYVKVLDKKAKKKPTKRK